MRQRRRRPSWPSRRALARTLLAAAVAVAGAAAWQAYARRSGERQFAAYQRGVLAFRAQDWPLAAARFGALLQAQPQHARARRYVRAIGRERRAAQDTEGAGLALQRGDYAHAWSLCIGVLDSTYRGAAQALMRRMEADLDARIAGARRALDGGRVAEAQTLLRPLEGAFSGRVDLAAQMVRLTLRTGPAHLAPAALARGAQARAGAAPSPAVQAASLQFAAGHLEAAAAALEALNSEDAAAMRAHLDGFIDAQQAALAHIARGEPEAALPLLRVARTQAQALCDGGGRMRQELEAQMAAMHDALGLRALGREHFAEAVGAFNAALGCAPGDIVARAKLAALVERARGLVAAAQQDKDRARARARLQQAQSMVSRQSELGRDIVQHLDALP